LSHLFSTAKHKISKEKVKVEAYPTVLIVSPGGYSPKEISRETTFQHFSESPSITMNDATH
jgi:hypothetical protein